MKSYFNMKDYSEWQDILELDDPLGSGPSRKTRLKHPNKKMLYGLFDIIDYVIDKLGQDTEMVEVGCYSGESTRIFAKKFKHVYAVEPWDLVKQAYHEIPNKTIEEAFRKHIAPCDNITVIKNKSLLAAEDFDKKVGFVYIDANHSFNAVLADIAAWKEKVLPGGILGGHDYGHPTRILGCTKAIDQYFGKPDKTFKDYSWLVHCKKNIPPITNTPYLLLV